MRRGKSGKRIGFHILSVLVLVLTFCLPVSAGVQEGEGEYEIYPTPQSVEYGTGTVTLTKKVNVTTGDAIDSYTKERIDATLEVLGLEKNASAVTGNTNLIVGVYNSKDAADTWGASHGVDASIYEKYDAYTLWIQDGTIVILGKNTDAAYYGVTTLKRIFEQLEGKTVKALTVKDYAEVEFRGFIEGYYGNPWSHEDRVDLMKFGGEIKMNQYVFAPKDDPYHNSRWRELYPEEDLKKVTALAKAGEESKCHFVYALHPFMNQPIQFSDYANELKIVKAKLQQVIDAGVRQIAILADDSGGATEENLCTLLNDLTTWLEGLQSQYAGLKKDILFCPTAYMGNGNDATIKTISANTGENVHIFMTGGAIWGQVYNSFLEGFYNNVKDSSGKSRYPYMWVNWPCSDNYKTGLIMGGHNTILHTGVDGQKMEGLVLNPMQQAEPSKNGIFTAADYSWNIWQEAAEGDQAWEDSFKYMDHLTMHETKESAALREVSKHMIYQGPVQTSGRQAKFEESVELHPKMDAFAEKVKAGTVTKADITEMRAEFQKIFDAAELYLKQGTNRRMAAAMEPFLNCLRDECKAAIDLTDALAAVEDGDFNSVWNCFSEAQAVYEQSKTYGFTYVSETKYATAGLLYIVPFTEKMMKYVADKLRTTIDPEHIKMEETLIYRVGGTESSGNQGDAAKAVDGNPNTNFQIQTDQQTGDYVGILFSTKVPVNSIRIALACTGHENDYIPNAVMEYTLDGNTWQEFEVQPEENTTTEISLSFEEMEIRGFRWRGTGVDRNRWLIIREIGYNITGWEEDDDDDGKYTVSAVTRTSAWTAAQGTSESSLTDGDDSTFVWYDSGQGTDGDSSLAGDFLQIDLGGVKEVQRVRALVGAGDGDKWVKYHLEYSETGVDGSWTALDSYTGVSSGTDTYEMEWDGISARYFRLVNEQKVDKWVKFSEFAAYAKKNNSLQGVEMDYTNTENGAWRVEYGDTSSSVVPKQNAVLNPGEYIGLKLDRIHEVASSVVTGANTDKLKFEQSVNQTVWTDAGQKGAARYIRLINKGEQSITFNLESFVVNTNEISPMDLLSQNGTNLGNNSTTEDARSIGTSRNWMDGNLTTAAKYCDTPKQGSFVTYDLGQEITLRSARIYVLDTAIDYPRDAILQASVDNQNWTDLITIGDGVSNTGDMNTKPVENDCGYVHDTVDVAYAYIENANIDNVKARYLRLYFTAAYGSRWVELNEILLNGGEYISTINDPTFETDSALLKGFEPQNLNDGDFMTAFKPADEKGGSLIYNLSEETEIGRINILQSGNSISNAKVSVRTDADTWVEVGTMNRSYSAFYTADLDQVLAVKLEWKDTAPVVYEIITLKNPGDVLEKNYADGQRDVETAEAEVATAENAVEDAKKLVTAAVSKVNAAANEEDKLKAEVELQKAYAEQSKAEAVVAEKKAMAAKAAAALAKTEARNLRIQAANADTEDEKARLEAEADKKEETASIEMTEAEKQQGIADDKEKEQASYEQAAADKQAELEKLQTQSKPQPTPTQPTPTQPTPTQPTPTQPTPQPTITSFNYKNVTYKVLDSAKKTVAAVGVTTKKVKSVTVYKTVKKDGTTWKVVEIGAKAFKGCKKLTKVTIGANVTKIGSQAFANCTNLKNVNLKKAAKITSFGKKSFSKINAKAKITVPAKKRTKYKKLLKKAGVPKKAVIK